MSLTGARFVCLDEGGGRGEVIAAKGRKFTVGYYMSCDYVLNDSRAKKVHCEIRCDAFGRVTIHNMSEEHPISVNNNPIGIKRCLLNGTHITILDKKFLWEFPKNTSNEYEDLASDKLSTPQKQVGIPEQPPSSCPDFRLHREIPKRFTVHNFAYCIQSDEEGNTSIESDTCPNEDATNEDMSNQDEEQKTTSTTSQLDIPAESKERRSITPEPKPAPQDLEHTPKMNLINCTQNKENTSTQKKKNLLSLCHQSDVVITSFSPRETGVRIEKSFATVLKPTTPRSVYSTPKSVFSDYNDDGSRDFIDFSTPSTSKKGLSRLATNSSMHLIDLTTPTKLRPASPFLKSALKGSVKANQRTVEKPPSSTTKKQMNFADVIEEHMGVSPLPVTPLPSANTKSSTKTPGSIDSVISVESTDTSSVIEISGDDSTPETSAAAVSSQHLAKTPTKSRMQKVPTTPMRTPQSLMKRALLTSAKKQGTPTTTTSVRRIIAKTPDPTTSTQRSPITPKSASARAAFLARRQSLTTPTRRSSVVSKLRLDSSPSTAVASTSRVARTSLLSPLTGRELTTSTPKLHSLTKLRTPSKTSPLHKVRKSFAGTTLSGHISKARKSIGNSSNRETPTRSAQLVARSRSSLCPSTSKPKAPETSLAASSTSILKDPQSARKTVESKKAVLFEDKVLSEANDDLSRTFILESDDEEAKPKDATFSPNKTEKSVLNVTFSPVKNEEEKIPDNDEAVVDITIDVAEVDALNPDKIEIKISSIELEDGTETATIQLEDEAESASKTDDGEDNLQNVQEPLGDGLISESFAEIVDEEAECTDAEADIVDDEAECAVAEAEMAERAENMTCADIDENNEPTSEVLVDEVELYQDNMEESVQQSAVNKETSENLPQPAKVLMENIEVDEVGTGEEIAAIESATPACDRIDKLTTEYDLFCEDEDEEKVDDERNDKSKVPIEQPTLVAEIQSSNSEIELLSEELSDDQNSIVVKATEDVPASETEKDNSEGKDNVDQVASDSEEPKQDSETQSSGIEGNPNTSEAPPDNEESIEDAPLSKELNDNEEDEHSIVNKNCRKVTIEKVNTECKDSTEEVSSDGGERKEVSEIQPNIVEVSPNAEQPTSCTELDLFSEELDDEDDLVSTAIEEHKQESKESVIEEDISETSILDHDPAATKEPLDKKENADEVSTPDATVNISITSNINEEIKELDTDALEESSSENKESSSQETEDFLEEIEYVLNKSDELQRQQLDELDESIQNTPSEELEVSVVKEAEELTEEKKGTLSHKEDGEEKLLLEEIQKETVIANEEKAQKEEEKSSVEDIKDSYQAEEDKTVERLPESPRVDEIISQVDSGEVEEKSAADDSKDSQQEKKHEERNVTVAGLEEHESSIEAIEPVLSSPQVPEENEEILDDKQEESLPLADKKDSKTVEERPCEILINEPVHNLSQVMEEEETESTTATESEVISLDDDKEIPRLSVLLEEELEVPQKSAPKTPNLCGVRDLMRTPKATEPKTPRFAGLRNLMRTPKTLTDQMDEFEGVQTLLETPQVSKGKCNTDDVPQSSKKSTTKAEPVSTFTPRRSARRASVSAEATTSIFTPTRRTRRSSLTVEATATLTPKRITTRRLSISMDDEPSAPFTPRPKRIALFEESINEMGEIIEDNLPKDESAKTKSIDDRNSKTSTDGAKEIEKKPLSVDDETENVGVDPAVLEDNICEIVHISESHEEKTIENSAITDADKEKIIHSNENEALPTLQVEITHIEYDATCEPAIEDICVNTELQPKEFDESIGEILDESDYEYGKEVGDTKAAIKTATTDEQLPAASTPKSRRIMKLEDASSSPKTPVMVGMRELIETPKPSDTTPKRVDLPKQREEDAIDDDRKVEGTLAELVKTPKAEIKYEQSDDNEDPCSSAHFIGMRELLQTPKSCSTPRLRGLREMMKTPKVTSTPYMGGIKSLMDTPKLGTPISTIASAHTGNEVLKQEEVKDTTILGLNATYGEGLDKFFTTPRAKNIMIPADPASAVIEKSTDSVEMIHSTEVDLNVTNMVNLEDIFRTPVASRFAERLNDGKGEEEEGDEGSLEELAVEDDASHSIQEDQEKDESISEVVKLTDTEEEAPKNLSAEEAFDEMIGQSSANQTPAKNVYTRKSLAGSMQQSPFSASDVISDLPKTDIQEWVDSLEDADPPNDEPLDESLSQSEEPDVTIEPNVHELSRDPLAASAAKNSNNSRLTESCGKIFMPDTASTSSSMLNISTISTVSDPLASSSALKSVNKSVSNFQRLATVEENPPVVLRPISPTDAEMSGINLLDDSSESIFSEPLLVSDTESIDGTVAESTMSSSQQNVQASLEQTIASKINEELSVESESKAKPQTVVDLLCEGIKSEFQNFKEDAIVLQQRSQTPDLRKVRSKLSRQTMDAQDDLVAVDDFKTEIAKLKNEKKKAIDKETTATIDEESTITKQLKEDEELIEEESLAEVSESIEEASTTQTPQIEDMTMAEAYEQAATEPTELIGEESLAKASESSESIEEAGTMQTPQSEEDSIAEIASKEKTTKQTEQIDEKSLASELSESIEEVGTVQTRQSEEDSIAEAAAPQTDQIEKESLADSPESSESIDEAGTIQTPLSEEVALAELSESIEEASTSKTSQIDKKSMHEASESSESIVETAAKPTPQIEEESITISSDSSELMEEATTEQKPIAEMSIATASEGTTESKQTEESSARTSASPDLIGETSTVQISPIEEETITISSESSELMDEAVTMQTQTDVASDSGESFKETIVVKTCNDATSKEEVTTTKIQNEEVLTTKEVEHEVGTTKDEEASTKESESANTTVVEVPESSSSAEQPTEEHPMKLELGESIKDIQKEPTIHDVLDDESSQTESNGQKTEVIEMVDDNIDQESSELTAKPSTEMLPSQSSQTSTVDEPLSIEVREEISAQIIEKESHQSTVTCFDFEIKISDNTAAGNNEPTEEDIEEQGRSEDSRKDLTEGDEKSQAQIIGQLSSQAEPLTECENTLSELEKSSPETRQSPSKDDKSMEQISEENQDETMPDKKRNESEEIKEVDEQSRQSADISVEPCSSKDNKKLEIFNNSMEEPSKSEAENITSASTTNVKEVIAGDESLAVSKIELDNADLVQDTKPHRRGRKASQSSTKEEELPKRRAGRRKVETPVVEVIQENQLPEEPVSLMNEAASSIDEAVQENSAAQVKVDETQKELITESTKSFEVSEENVKRKVRLASYSSQGSTSDLSTQRRRGGRKKIDTTLEEVKEDKSHEVVESVETVSRKESLETETAHNSNQLIASETESQEEAHAKPSEDVQTADEIRPKRGRRKATTSESSQSSVLEGEQSTRRGRRKNKNTPVEIAEADEEVPDSTENVQITEDNQKVENLTAEDAQPIGDAQPETNEPVDQQIPSETKDEKEAVEESVPEDESTVLVHENPHEHEVHSTKSAPKRKGGRRKAGEPVKSEESTHIGSEKAETSVSHESEEPHHETQTSKAEPKRRGGRRKAVEPVKAELVIPEGIKEDEGYSAEGHEVQETQDVATTADESESSAEVKATIDSSTKRKRGHKDSTEEKETVEVSSVPEEIVEIHDQNTDNVTNSLEQNTQPEEAQIQVVDTANVKQEDSIQETKPVPTRKRGRKKTVDCAEPEQNIDEVSEVEATTNEVATESPDVEDEIPVEPATAELPTEAEKVPEKSAPKRRYRKKIDENEVQEKIKDEPLAAELSSTTGNTDTEHEIKAPTRRRAGRKAKEDHEEVPTTTSRRMGRKKADDHQDGIEVHQEQSAESIQREDTKTVSVDEEPKQDPEASKIDETVQGTAEAPHNTENTKKRRGAATAAAPKRGGRKKKEPSMDRDEKIVEETVEHETETTTDIDSESKQDEQKDIESHTTSHEEDNVSELHSDEPAKKRGRKAAQVADTQAENETQPPVTAAAPRRTRKASTLDVDHAETPQRAAAAPRVTRKASTLDVDHSVHEAATPQPNRNRPRRAAAAVEHNYNEGSDTEKHTDVVKRSGGSARKVTDSESATATTSRGRTRKITQKVQQLIEEERAKASTPKKRILLAVESPTPQKMSSAVRRGRKPSTIETDAIVGHSTTPQITKRGRGRTAATVDHTSDQSHSHSEVTVSEVEEHHSSHAEEPKEPSAAKGRARGGRKAKAEPDAESGEPPSKKSPQLLTAEKIFEVDNESGATTPQRPVSRRGVKAAAPSSEDTATENALPTTTKRGHVRRAASKNTSIIDLSSDEEQQKKTTTRRRAVKTTKKQEEGPEKRVHRIASASTVDGPIISENMEAGLLENITSVDGCVDVPHPATAEDDESLAHVAEKVAAKRTATSRKATTSDSPAAKRGRRKAGEDATEAASTKPTRGGGRGRKVVRFEPDEAAVSSTSTAAPAAEGIPAVEDVVAAIEETVAAETTETAAAVAAPKRATRTRRK